jgi:hypothetical protein
LDHRKRGGEMGKGKTPCSSFGFVGISSQIEKARTKQKYSIEFPEENSFRALGYK